MGFWNQEITNVHSAAFLLGAAGLLSRLLGILRDRMLASNFGAGRELDIYYMAFQIPDFLSVLFLLGAGSASILPIFQGHLNKGKKEAKDLISQLGSYFFMGSILVSCAVFFIAPLWIELLTPGFLEKERSVTLTLSRIMLLSPIFFGLSSIFSVVVQSFQRFWVYAMAPLFYNLGIIVGIIFLVPQWGLLGLAFGVVLGAFSHFLIQLISASRLGFFPSFSFTGDLVGIVRVASVSIPRVLSLSSSHITLFILTAIASTFAAGSITVFTLAQNLYHLPVYIFGASYAIVVFPRLSTAYLNQDGVSFFKELSWGIRAILFWVLPFSVLFIVLRAHIVRVALGTGAFSWEDTRLTAAALAVFALAICSSALIALIVRGFYALENTWKPLLVNILASGVSIIVAFLFSSFMSDSSAVAIFLKALFRIHDMPSTEIIGIVFGFLVGTFLNMSILLAMLWRLSKSTFGTKFNFPWVHVFKMIIASITCGAGAYLVRVSFSGTVPLITFMQVLTQGFLAGLLGLGIYVGFLFILRSEEVFTFSGFLGRRLFKTGLLPKSWDGYENRSPIL